jgi:hypothetical protein
MHVENVLFIKLLELFSKYTNGVVDHNVVRYTEEVDLSYLEHYLNDFGFNKKNEVVENTNSILNMYYKVMNKEVFLDFLEIFEINLKEYKSTGILPNKKISTFKDFYNK